MKRLLEFCECGGLLFAFVFPISHATSAQQIDSGRQAASPTRTESATGTINSLDSSEDQEAPPVDEQSATDGSSTSQPTGTAVCADKRLYCFDERGQVGLLDPTAGRLAVTGQFQLIADRVRDAWAHTVIHDGRLYLRDHESLWCEDASVLAMSHLLIPPNRSS